MVRVEFGLVIIGAAFILLDLLAYRFGVDTRDGFEWIAHAGRAPYLTGDR